MILFPESQRELAARSRSASRRNDLLICFSHLRWDFVFQRPQHLMTRFGKTYRVLFFEEPIERAELPEPELDRRTVAPGVEVATPLLPPGLDDEARTRALRALVDHVVATDGRPAVAWYYTPMMVPFSFHLGAGCVVYDCMDELANFRFAPPELLALEQRLLDRADVVFTGGYSLYEAKRQRHGNVHPFPSSVDLAHFMKARSVDAQPADQADIPGPRFGFYGVIDERFDTALLDAVAAQRPDWSFVMLGPVVKISEDELPRRDNIHYLGGKTYEELPAYLGGWDVALMPFAINAATRFISPTKTPEYLAGGRPVVSTPIADVKRHYGNITGVRIARTPEQFLAACDAALELSRDTDRWLPEVDLLLSGQSWDITQARMAGLIDQVLAADTRRLQPQAATA
ncbi:glycosyltransferase family 1 protein [Sphingomonas mesophila]|uniref:glycosyltransferase family 1 protein n=1 Tax=Sphingomonas mesophila TaxID=2303576 RepID=UPI000E579314|nr:glycosyltransferase family 1 protein [Sphingomonas mesophila]